jgi:DNA adenine methylase
MLIKWVGSKARLASNILARLAPFDDYVEPFLGGGSIFFALATAGRITRARLSDANPHLIRMYEGVRDQPEAVVRALNAHRDQHSAAHYYAIRQTPPEDLAEAAAWFLYLNRAGFNGLWRTNRAGAYNVSWGKRDAVADLSEAILGASRLLQGATLRCEPWTAALRDVGPGAAVYADPPYIPLTASRSFTGYTGDGFPGEEQAALRDRLLELARGGVQVVASNSAAPVALELYADFRTELIPVKHSVSASGASRGAVNELLAWL